MINLSDPAILNGWIENFVKQNPDDSNVIGCTVGNVLTFLKHRVDFLDKEVAKYKGLYELAGQVVIDLDNNKSDCIKRPEITKEMLQEMKTKLIESQLKEHSDLVGGQLRMVRELIQFLDGKS